MDLQEENAQRKSRIRNEKKNHDSDDGEDVNTRQLLSLHPLSVVLTVKIKDNNAVLVKFQYAQTLRIVTTKCSLELAKSSKPLLVDILNCDNLLNLLFPDDTGMESPNPATEYQLQKLRLSGLSSEQLKALGKPYKWAQTLAGLSFVSCEIPSSNEPLDNAKLDNQEDAEEKEPSPQTISSPKQFTETLSWKVSAEHMHNTVTAIKRRLQARLSLYSQFLVLETATSTSQIPISPETLQQLFPGKVCSELTSWRPVTWADYEASSATRHILECGVVDNNFLPFKAIFQRQSVTLEAFVAISPDYSNVAPIFALKLDWKNEETASTNPHIRQMESEVNTYYGELASNRTERLQLLSLQLYRLAMCLDILTEATSIQTEVNPSPSQFHKEKIFFRPARGPDRVLPFKYLPKLGVFAQR
ncbi:UNVERIFIED_CONTAM: hypothetical protein GTU68_033115 [Idotea baltica]|nr:hypothetical protein [Idotea baltica]